jgi:hypothetical protein
MSDYFDAAAAEDFDKARNKAFLSKIMSILGGRDEELLSLSEMRELIKPRGETYKGMQVVELSRIVGSEGRYRDFNRHFLPRHDHLRKRWERVDQAHLKSIILPPIQLYEIAGLYFVRDGNHRVSVARAQNAHAIDAEVVKLDSEIVLKPGIGREELKRAVIDYEKRAFYAETFFGDLTEDFSLDFSSTGRYDVILNHILTHKYYINQGAKDEIPFETALLSWYNTVYKPVVDLIDEEKLTRRFPGRTKADLYVWIVRYWDELKKKYGLDYSLGDAAKDFSERFGEGFWERIGKAVAKALKKIRKVFKR